MGRRTLKALGMDKIGLNEREKRAVKKWLKQPPEIQRRKCPFSAMFAFHGSQGLKNLNLVLAWFISCEP